MTKVSHSPSLGGHFEWSPRLVRPKLWQLLSKQAIFEPNSRMFRVAFLAVSSNKGYFMTKVSHSPNQGGHFEWSPRVVRPKLWQLLSKQAIFEPNLKEAESRSKAAESRPFLHNQHLCILTEALVYLQ